MGTPRSMCACGSKKISACGHPAPGHGPGSRWPDPQVTSCEARHGLVVHVEEGLEVWNRYERAAPPRPHREGQRLRSATSRASSGSSVPSMWSAAPPWDRNGGAISDPGQYASTRSRPERAAMQSVHASSPPNLVPPYSLEVRAGPVDLKACWRRADEGCGVRPPGAPPRCCGSSTSPALSRARRGARAVKLLRGQSPRLEVPERPPPGSSTVPVPHP